jgi:predicted short-subunit dehydrogenase-like oxidoreductase (DUF2520 family)
MSDRISVRIVGPGRAGQSFASAFAEVGVSAELLARDADIALVADGVDAVLLCTPDAAIATAAAAIEPGPAAILHCSGATPLTVLDGHERIGSLHPLMALPDAETGSARLRDHGWFAVAGDPIAGALVEALGGRRFDVPDEFRARYHATAAVAANHLVALLGQVERLAASVGVPVEAFLDLAAGSFDDVRRIGATAALTGPAARGDHSTLDAHRASLPTDEVELYEVLAAAAAKLARPNEPDEL